MEDLSMVGEKDTAVSSVVGYLEKRSVYYLRGNRLGSFVRWDNQRRHSVNSRKVIETVHQISTETKEDVIVILNRKLPAHLKEEHSIKKIVEFTGCTVRDEKFYLYRYRVDSD